MVNEQTSFLMRSFLPFFWKNYPKKISCFSDSIVQKATEQSNGYRYAAGDAQFIPGYGILRKIALSFLQRRKKFTLSVKVTELQKSRYQKILIGVPEKLLQERDFLFHLSAGGFSTYIIQAELQWQTVVRRGQVFDDVQTAVWFNQRGVDRMLERRLKKNYKKGLMRSVQKTKSTWNSGVAFAERVEHVGKTEIGLEP